MSRDATKDRPHDTDPFPLASVEAATMGKLSDEDVVVADAPSDIEESLEAKSKGGWFQRIWGTSELDVKERKYVRKVDLYLL